MLAVALVLAALARISSGVAGRAVLLAATAVAVLGIFCLAEGSIPLVWLSAAALGQGLGWLAGRLTGRPLLIGSSFGGIDYLVLMTVLAAGWLASTPPPRRARAIGVAAAILLGHLAYLSCWPAVRASLRPCPMSSRRRPTTSRTWASGPGATPCGPCCPGTCRPWPCSFMRRLPASFSAGDRGLRLSKDRRRDAVEEEEATGARALAVDALLRFGPGVLAVLLPIVTMLAIGPSDLKDRTIVAYDAPGWIGPIRYPTARLPARHAASACCRRWSRTLADNCGTRPSCPSTIWKGPTCCCC